MQKNLITVLFDNEDNLCLCDRDFDRFILTLSQGESIKEKLLAIFEQKGYSWDNFEQFEKGYKPIMAIRQDNLSDLEVY